MKWFIAESVDEQGVAIPPSGEPVIPGIPMSSHNNYLSLESYTVCQMARIDNVDIDCDMFLDKLCMEYPGLPRAMLKSIMLDTGVAAHKLPEGVKFRVFVTPDKARVQSVDDDTLAVTLWDNFEPSKF